MHLFIWNHGASLGLNWFFFFFCKYCSLLFFLVYAGVLGLGVPRGEGLQPGGVSFLVIAKWQLNR